MPISMRVPIRRLSQQEFGELSFEVMRHVFAIHNEIGRFFDERIYKCELATRVPGVRLEEPVTVTFDSFQKQYFIDALVGDGGIFEFKAAQALSGRHRAQLRHYLILCDVAHGKLINIRSNDVQHEYVNTKWQRADRIGFDADVARWNFRAPGATKLHEIAMTLVHDLGTGLETSLYEEAVAHFFGGIAKVQSDVPVEIAGRRSGFQRVRLLEDGVAMKITSFDRPPESFEIHARRLLAHTNLRAIAWINVDIKKVTFIVLEPNRDQQKAARTSLPNS